MGKEGLGEARNLPKMTEQAFEPRLSYLLVLLSDPPAPH